MKSYMNQLLLALSSVSLCTGFTLAPQPASTAAARHNKQHSSIAQLGVSFAANVEDETLYRQLMNNARLCAFSDTSSPAEAKRYLHDILHMESGCVAGTLAADFCDNVDETADIVVHLREKAAKQDALDLERASTVQFIFPLIAAVVFMSVMSMIIASTTTTTTIDTGNGAVPFELQEWGWAARDGYLPTMIEHYFRNGGL